MAHFFQVGLLKYNKHTEKCTHQKHMFQWIFTKWLHPSHGNLEGKGWKRAWAPSTQEPSPALLVFTSPKANCFWHFRSVFPIFKCDKRSHTLYILLSWLLSLDILLLRCIHVVVLSCSLLIPFHCVNEYYLSFLLMSTWVASSFTHYVGCFDDCSLVIPCTHVCWVHTKK